MRFSLKVVMYFLIFIVWGTLADTTFNYDINGRVQDAISAFLSQLVVGGNIPFLQIQSQIVLLSDFNSTLSGWKSGSSLFFPLKRALSQEMIIASLGTYSLVPLSLIVVDWLFLTKISFLRLLE